MSGTVAAGNTFAISTGSASDLKFTNTASTGAISITSANQTLEEVVGERVTPLCVFHDDRARLGKQRVEEADEYVGSPAGTEASVDGIDRRRRVGVNSRNC